MHLGCRRALSNGGRNSLCQWWQRYPCCLHCCYEQALIAVWLSSSGGAKSDGLKGAAYSFLCCVGFVMAARCPRRWWHLTGLPAAQPAMSLGAQPVKELLPKLLGCGVAVGARGKAGCAQGRAVFLFCSRGGQQHSYKVQVEFRVLGQLLTLKGKLASIHLWKLANFRQRIFVHSEVMILLYLQKSIFFSDSIFFKNIKHVKAEAIYLLWFRLTTIKL